MKMDLETLLAGLRAGNDPTRLRLLALLAHSDLNVKDLTRILRQSQPRISRHLKLLHEAGMIHRFQEGSWVFYRRKSTGAGAALATEIAAFVDQADPIVARDRERFIEIKEERATAAAEYFRARATDWDRLRALHISEQDVEAAMLDTLGKRKFGRVLDLGTGTGRILELLADRIDRGIGVDASQEMLALARTRFEKSDLHHCQARFGDLYDLVFEAGDFDAVIIHQVLHYLDDPAGAIAVAARLLAPGGQLLIVDFAPHEHEFLRNEHTHQRLGFATSEVSDWISDTGLNFVKSRKLAPPGKAGKTAITVTLWLGERPAETSRKSSLPAIEPRIRPT